MRPVLLAAPVALLALLLAWGAAAAAADTEPPSVSISSPSPGTLYNSSDTPPHAGQAGVGSVAAIVDHGTPPGSMNISFAVFPSPGPLVLGENYTLNIQPSGPNGSIASLVLWLPEGNYVLTWTATDSGGNAGEASVPFAVDLEGPAISVSYPPLSTVPDVWATLDIVDAVSGVDATGVQVYFRSGCSDGKYVQVHATLTALGGHVVGEVLLHPCEGLNNSLQVAATDRAGHTSGSGVLDLGLDTLAPTVSGQTPLPFTIVDGPQVQLSAVFTDIASGTNESTIEYQLSADGGATWGPWTHASVNFTGGVHFANATVTLEKGDAAAVRWRAYDLAGNGPGKEQAVHFHVNGPPFLVSYEPLEETQVVEGRDITFTARFADPDADTVRTTFSSDIDGYLGEISGRHEIDPTGESFSRALSVGVHNITITGDDGHGNRVQYIYDVTVIPRPPPDFRPFLVLALMGATMAAVTWVAWKRAEEMGADEGARDGSPAEGEDAP